MPDDADRQKRRDELSAKLDRAATIVGDLLKVHRAYGERGPAAVYRHTEQLDEDELRHVVTAMVVYISTSNAAVAAMFTNPGPDDGPVLH